MAYQPYEDTSDTNEFNQLEGKLTLFSYSQADNNVLYSPRYNDSSSPSPESLALNNLNESLNENYGSNGILSDLDEPLFPEAQLGDPFFMDPFEVPINEVTVTTTPSDAENDNNNTPVGLNLISDRINLKSVDSSIQQQLISVSVHPTNDPRRRYKSEGKRRIKKIRSNLMTLDLSKLQEYNLDSNQSLWLRLTLITVNDNPSVSVKIYIHPFGFKYPGEPRIGKDGSICIRVTQSDIDQGRIELKDLEIIKILDKAYTFKLIPYSLSEMDNKSEDYAKDETKTQDGNAKLFRKKYNVKASQIACQILIEQEKKFHFTHITCVTNVMTEQQYEPKATKPIKRSIKKNRKSGKKRRNTTKSKSIKRKTRSNN